MSKPKPREYIVHEHFLATTAYYVMASSKAEALAIAQSADPGTLASDATEPMPTGTWWVEPRARKR
jgi:hypothetical protein